MAKKKAYEFEPDWTFLRTFTLGELPRDGECKGCLKTIRKGTEALFKTRPSPHNQQHTLLICVCNEECLADYDHKFWQDAADRKAEFEKASQRRYKKPWL